MPTHAAHRRREVLESLYREFHRPELLGSDPLQTLYRYDDPADREVAGLIAALLAYGNVKAIQRGIDAALGRMLPSPRRYLDGRSARQICEDFRGFRYRVTSAQQMAGLLVGVKRMVGEHGGLNAAFLAGSPSAGLLDRLGGFVDGITAAGSDPLLHLLPHPGRGSACKRLMLWLRWMVRHDAIDPGGWTGVSPSELIVPLDTHVHRMSRRLGLTRRRVANLATAVQITARLATCCPEDPLRYDFSLTRPGILRIAPPQR